MPADDILTETTVDVSSWFRPGRLTARLTDDGLLLFADGRRRYEQTIRFADLTDSVYNHLTGELVLAPAAGAQISILKMSPLAGCRLLQAIRLRAGVNQQDQEPEQQQVASNAKG